MRVFLAIVLGVAIGAAAVWVIKTHPDDSRVRGATDKLENATKNARDAVTDKLRVLELRTNDFKEELARTGQVIRRKAGEAGKALADATADARITAAIKAKLVAHRDLSALSISVNTTSGIVTLSGTVPNNESISQAMLLAMETDGVREVISTLQVKRREG